MCVRVGEGIASYKWVCMRCRFTFYSLFMDIQKSFLDIHNSIFGYPKIDFRISIIRFMDIQKSALFKDILKSNYGYPKIELWISKNQQYLRISLITLLDIQKSCLILDIQKCIL